MAGHRTEIDELARAVGEKGERSARALADHAIGARDELVEENGERIEAAFEEMAPELLGGAADKVRKALAKAFIASKSLGFK